MVVILLWGVLGLLAWVATAGLVVVARAPSDSPSEATNGLAIGLIPYTFLPACGLTAPALLVVGAFARSPAAKAVTFVLGAAVVVAGCVGVAAVVQQ